MLIGEKIDGRVEELADFLGQNKKGVIRSALSDRKENSPERELLFVTTTMACIIIYNKNQTNENLCLRALEKALTLTASTADLKLVFQVAEESKYTDIRDGAVLKLNELLS